MVNKRWRIPSRNRSEGYIPIGELVGVWDRKIRRSAQPAGVSRQKPEPRMASSRWVRRSFIYKLTGQN
jgi:hypothetical protein